MDDTNELTEELVKLIGRNMEKMLYWDIEMTKTLENGAIVSVRQGDFFEKQWWAVFLEVQLDNEEHEKDIPPEDEWGDYALMSFQIGDRGMVLWVFESMDVMTVELSRLFGMFYVDPLEWI